jgi:hypothetical protein
MPDSVVPVAMVVTPLVVCAAAVWAAAGTAGKIPNPKIPNPKKIPTERKRQYDNFNGENFKGAEAAALSVTAAAMPEFFLECGDLSPLLTGKFISPPTEGRGFVMLEADGAGQCFEREARQSAIAPSKAATSRRTPKIPALPRQQSGGGGVREEGGWVKVFMGGGWVSGGG